MELKEYENMKKTQIYWTWSGRQTGSKKRCVYLFIHHGRHAGHQSFDSHLKEKKQTNRITSQF